jgi:hypothetical protein
MLIYFANSNTVINSLATIFIYMKYSLSYLVILLLICSCNSDPSQKFVKSINNNEILFDISFIDTIITKKLTNVDSVTFNKYIYQNPVILGIDYGPPNPYGDGFWIKKYADSLRNDLIYRGFSKSNFYRIPTTLIKNSILVIRCYPEMELYEHYALYLIKTDVKSNYPSTILLAEKMKSQGLAAIYQITKSVFNKSTSAVKQTTISKYSFSDLPGPKGEIMSFYDTTVTYYELKNNCFDRYRRTIVWEGKQE